MTCCLVCLELLFDICCDCKGVLAVPIMFELEYCYFLTRLGHAARGPRLLVRCGKLRYVRQECSTMESSAMLGMCSRIWAWGMSLPSREAVKNVLLLCFYLVCPLSFVSFVSFVSFASWPPSSVLLSCVSFVLCVLCVLCLLAPLFCSSCLLYTSPSPRDRTRSRMPSSA